MKNLNKADTTIRITSYENGVPFISEHEVNGVIDVDDISELCECHDFLRNGGDIGKNEDGTDIIEYEISMGDIAFEDDTNEEPDNATDEAEYVPDDLEEFEDAVCDDIERMNDDLNGMKIAGAVIMAAQLLLSIGFFCLHGKLVRGNKVVK